MVRKGLWTRCLCKVVKHTSIKYHIPGYIS
jgi:hypothetical protein